MARSLPATVKMSAASKRCSGNFGLAAACGKVLRQLLLPVLPFSKDRRMQVKFSGSIARWLGAADITTLPAATTLPYVSSFQFNAATGIAQRWKTALTVEQTADGNIVIQIPAFIPTQSISAPADCVEVECVFMVAGCQLAHAAGTGSNRATMVIPYTKVPVSTPTIELVVNTLPGQVILTVAAMRYRTGNGIYCRLPAYLPASVIDARYT